jgi:hypothetical protein
MTGTLNGQTVPGPATPGTEALEQLDRAMGEVRFEVRQALLAYRDAAEAQDRLIARLERIVLAATGEVHHG